jgi:DNA-directed RNA polymerase III subunit RPC2
VSSDSDPTFYLRFDSIRVDAPAVKEEGMSQSKVTPHQCRLRDATYAAPVFVSIRYTRGSQVIQSNDVQIGRLPIMLKSEKCALHGRSDYDLAIMKECPIDPGGYFVVKGVEKVVLIQEQLSKNRIIIDVDSKGDINATVISSTHERKSRTNIVFKGDRIYLRLNMLTEDVPIIILMRAMGIMSDLEVVSMVGPELEYATLLSPSIEEATEKKVFTQKQALDFLGTRIKSKLVGKRIRPKEEEALNVLQTVVLQHIESSEYDFNEKALIHCAHDPPPHPGTHGPVHRRRQGLLRQQAPGACRPADGAPVRRPV